MIVFGQPVILQHFQVELIAGLDDGWDVSGGGVLEVLASRPKGCD